MIINWWCCFVLFFTFVWMLTSLYRVLFCTQTFTCNVFIFFILFFFSLLWISGKFALVLVDALFGKKINIDDGMHCKMYQREIHVHLLFKNKTKHSCFGPFIAIFDGFHRWSQTTWLRQRNDFNLQSDEY